MILSTIPTYYFKTLLIDKRPRSNGGIIMAGKKDVLGKEPTPMPYCPPKIQHKLTWDQTCDSAVTVRRVNL